MTRTATPPATPAINPIELPPEAEEESEGLTQAVREVEAGEEVLPEGHTVHDDAPLVE